MEAVVQNKTRLAAGLNDLDLYDLATTKQEYTSWHVAMPIDDWRLMIDD